jgi:putative two-component system response regulator
MHDTRRIFIVDDTPENLEILGELLSEYSRGTALDGIDALNQLRQQDAPDLILLDISMPGMDGFEVCQHLKTDPRLAAVPVIFITSMNDSAAEAKGFQLGAVDYITKPFYPAVVKARVKTHIELKAAKEELALQNHVLEEQVMARTGQLQEALNQVTQGSLETILKLSRAAEFKDECTGEHLVRMSHFSAAVARQLGMNDRQIDLLLHAAPMHDIGKIGIPDRIILKPGKLDPEEFSAMQQHTLIGAKILSGSHSEVINLAEEIALSHHERWDGTGYPNKLKGEEIPICARIASIADVFDALTSVRPYKPAFSTAHARELIAKERGRQFDPIVTDAFLANFDEILSIKARFEDAKNNAAPTLDKTIGS